MIKDMAALFLYRYPRSQALPGNADREALPPVFNERKSEAEPLDLRYQAEPGNEESTIQNLKSKI